MSSAELQHQFAQMRQLGNTHDMQVAAKAAIDKFLAGVAQQKHDQQVLDGKFGMWSQARLAWRLGRYEVLVGLAFKLGLMILAGLVAFSAVIGLLYAASGLFRRQAVQ